MRSINQFTATLTSVGVTYLLIAVALVFCFYMPLFAQSGADINRSYDGLVWAPDGRGGLSCGDGAVRLIGNDNIEQAFTYFIQKGLTEAQSAGIVGNLIHESGVDPRRVEVKQGEPPGYRTFDSVEEIESGRGYGIAQWTYSTRQEAWIEFSEDRNLPITDLGLQLEFLWEELMTTPNFGYDELVEAGDDMRQATWIFLAYFENPQIIIDAGKSRDPNQPTSGPAYSLLNTRYEDALSVINQFGGSNIANLSGACALNVGEPNYSANGVRLDGSPPGAHRDSNCTGGFTDGAQALQDFVLATWRPPVTSVGGYYCRPINHDPNEPTSIHGLGRALDIMVNANTPEGLAAGNEIRNWMINNSEIVGVQRVIWNRHIWTSTRDGWRDYGGPFPHDDHLHVEINEDGANMILPWYQGR